MISPEREAEIELAEKDYFRSNNEFMGRKAFKAGARLYCEKLEEAENERDSWVTTATNLMRERDELKVKLRRYEHETETVKELRAERDKLRAALEKIKDDKDSTVINECLIAHVPSRAAKIAKEALENIDG